MNPFWLFGSAEAWSRLASEMLRLNLSAGEVIARRSVMMMTGALSASEAATMLLEKPGTVVASAGRAIRAAARGRSPAAVAEAALRPYKARTVANARRLRH